MKIERLFRKSFPITVDFTDYIDNSSRIEERLILLQGIGYSQNYSIRGVMIE
jgi:hypothetical protein